MEKIKKQIPIDSVNVDRIENFVSTEFSTNFNDKTNEILNSFFSIITYEKIGIMNLLSVDEAMFLCDIMYTQRYSTQISPKTFLIEHIQNAIVLGKVDSDNYTIHSKIFIEKIQKLSEYQCYVLIISAYELNANKNSIEDNEYNHLIKKVFLINEETQQNLEIFQNPTHKNRF